MIERMSLRSDLMDKILLAIAKFMNKMSKFVTQNIIFVTRENFGDALVLATEDFSVKSFHIVSSERGL